MSRRRDQVDPQVWARRDMRRFLAVRNLGGVYRLLQRYGMSQRAIAAITGHTQGEVSEISSGRRQVLAYDVLLRVAVGFGLPRGWMGLDYDADTTNHLLSMSGGES